jgi:hypothetical protein
MSNSPFNLRTIFITSSGRRSSRMRMIHSDSVTLPITRLPQNLKNRWSHSCGNIKATENTCPSIIPQNRMHGTMLLTAPRCRCWERPAGVSGKSCLYEPRLGTVMVKKARARRAPARVVVPPDVRDEVLKRCQRHCCMCFGLHQRWAVAGGQLAHVDRDRTNAAIENLVFLCQDCHTVYDTKNNRVLSFTPGELTYYRDKLYLRLRIDVIEWTITVRGLRTQYAALKSAVDTAHASLLKCCSDVILNESPVVQDD